MRLQPATPSEVNGTARAVRPPNGFIAANGLSQRARRCPTSVDAAPSEWLISIVLSAWSKWFHETVT